MHKITKPHSCGATPCALACLLALGGCALGPDFKPPLAPKVEGYTPQPLHTTSSTPEVAGGQAQHFVQGLQMTADWWTLFHSKALNALIRESLTNNPDVQAAQAALSVAREKVLAQRGSFFPSLGADFSASRHRTPSLLSPFETTATAAGSVYYSFYTPQVTVSYTPDVFGLNRRTVESLKAQEDAARFAGAATYITLSANVAGAAIQEASLRAQIATTRQLIGINSNMVDILHYQYSKGYASQLEVAAQESQLAQVVAGLPPLRKQLAQQRDLVAALAGRYPSDQPNQRFELSSLTLPEKLPISLPSQLVEQRPDIRQAEANLHAASAQIGIAIANRLPNLTLTADAGSMAEQAGKMFSGGTGFWDLGADLAQPLFQGGALLHQERAAKAAYAQAAAQYRSTVLTAFQNVADTLNALEQDADALQAAAQAQAAAQKTLDLTRWQLKGGLTGTLSLLNAEQTYQQAALSLVQAQANRYADTVALFQALGGGWWQSKDFTGNEHEK